MNNQDNPSAHADEPDPLANIIYIAVPESLERQVGELEINPEIMLPVEATGGTGDRWDPSDLSWEQIIAAMLKILAYKPDHEHADYYRRFVLEARPDVIEELTETGVFKAKNKDFER